MSEQDVKPVSNATGTYPALQPRQVEIPAGGNAAPETGKEVPAQAVKGPDLEAIAAKLNVATQSIGRDLRFKVDMDSGQSVIQVLDRETGEIIREIPPEKAELSLSASGQMQLRLFNGLA